MGVAASEVERLDTLDMWGLTLGLPEQMGAAVAAFPRPLPGLPAHDDVEHVLVLGMGGSGISGDVIAAIAAPVSPVPVLVSKDYELPGFVGPGTLVLAVSFSGGTEETLEAVTAAHATGAAVVCFSHGGALAERAAEWGVPHVPLPDGIPMPRAALGAMVVPLLLALEQLSIVPGAEAMIDQAMTHLRRRRDRWSRPGGDPEVLARRIGRTIPLVYGGGVLGAVAAARWKGQVNENAKAPAFVNRLPELCHNEACGWGQHGDITRQVLTLVELRHDYEHPQITRRFTLVNNLVDEVIGATYVVKAEGDNPLAQLLDLMLFGDLTSLHLSFDAGVDPGPIPALDYIKAGLAG